MEDKREERAAGIKVEGVTPYGGGDKGEQVGEMFDSIAPAYDLMNSLMTFGLCRYWRDRALRLCAGENSVVRSVLDVATGTGDVAFALLRRFPEAQVCGVDLSQGMLDVAARKARDLPADDAARLSFRKGDSLALGFPDNSFDLVTVAYGVRNFEHLDRGLAEMLRVLRPGGSLCIVELSEPEHKLLKGCYRLYAHKLIPGIGRLVSGDASAYSYLPKSIAACPQRRDMARLMQQAGFQNCRWKSLTCGAVTIYLGKKRI